MERMQPERSGEAGALDQAASAFLNVRPRLFGIAYRMLGSAAEAEDIVQDVWLKWQATDRSGVLDTAAFLSTITTRLAINVVQSARSRRETYVGPWLPEPVDTGADPELGAVRGEALQFAVLLLLEKLSPTERASYVLREAFDYPYREIAEILQLSEPNTRQLVARARKHIADERRATVSSADQRRLLEAFIAAAQKGDTAELEGLFASDIVSYSDGGGAARSTDPGPRSCPRGDFHRCVRFTFLDRRHPDVDRSKWAGIRAHLARWRRLCISDDRRFVRGYTPNHVGDEPCKASCDFTVIVRAEREPLAGCLVEIAVTGF